MPGADFTQAVTLGGEISATPHNDAWDNLEDFLNPRLGGGDAADLIICDATGNPRPVALSGDATVDFAGALSVFGGDADEKLGLTHGGVVRRGKSIIATEESRTNTAYGTLTTPDQVSSVVLPTDGLLLIGYQALWKGGPNVRAAIFLGANQLKIGMRGQTAPQTQAGAMDASALTTEYAALHTTSMGLMSSDGMAGGGDQSQVTTGQVVGAFDDRNANDAAMEIGGTVEGVEATGGLVAVFAAAGTYTVSVQFKRLTSGAVTVKERKLWVWTMGF